MLRWLLISLLGLLFSFLLLRPDPNLHLVACDIGQGDAILITHGDQQVLIDGGPNDSVLSCLSQYIPFWDRTIELIVLTNGDADHVTGLIDVLGHYQVEKLVTNHLVKDTARFKAFREVVAKENIAVYAPKAGDQIKLGALTFNVLWPENRLGQTLVWQKDVDPKVLGANTYSQTSANEQSIVLKLEYGDFDAILTGDIGTPTEKTLVDAGALTDVEVLKVGHHGSRYSSSETFLTTLSPELALISVGKNTYGHPTPEALQRLKASGAETLTTQESGNIEVITNGHSFWLR
ncbi:MAG: MBL fold metallo-hydrolase [Candidatus Chisholmbacteria bacterium]|nr:MBL fold metallo-hydrolase [Candidatus Chisholmbacteria bacterium]